MQSHKTLTYGLVFLVVIVSTAADDTPLASLWMSGALKAGAITLEPGLDGNVLYNGILAAFQSYITQLSDNIYTQMFQAAQNYKYQAFELDNGFNMEISQSNSSSPLDAFDDIISSVCGLMSAVLADYKNGTNKMSNIASLTPRSQVSKSSTVIPPTHKLQEMLFHLDYIIETDLNRLTIYMEDILNLAKQNVLQYYQEVASLYWEHASIGLDGVKGVLADINRSQDFVKNHTSAAIWYQYTSMRDAISVIPGR